MTTWDDVLTMPHVAAAAPPHSHRELGMQPLGKCPRCDFDRAESLGRPQDIPRTPDGCHNAERETETERETKTPSSLSASQRAAAIRDLNELDAATRTILGLRPTWAPLAVRDALAGDPRPWATVVAAAVTAALDLDIGHPNAIRTTKAATRAATSTPIPPTLAERRAELRALEAEAAREVPREAEPDDTRPEPAHTVGTDAP